MSSKRILNRLFVDLRKTINSETIHALSKNITEEEARFVMQEEFTGKDILMINQNRNIYCIQNIFHQLYASKQYIAQLKELELTPYNIAALLRGSDSHIKYILETLTQPKNINIFKAIISKSTKEPIPEGKITSTLGFTVYQLTEILSGTNRKIGEALEKIAENETWNKISVLLAPKRSSYVIDGQAIPGVNFSHAHITNILAGSGESLINCIELLCSKFNRLTLLCSSSKESRYIDGTIVRCLGLVPSGLSAILSRASTSTYHALNQLLSDKTWGRINALFVSVFDTCIVYDDIIHGLGFTSDSFIATVRGSGINVSKAIHALISDENWPNIRTLLAPHDPSVTIRINGEARIGLGYTATLLGALASNSREDTQRILNTLLSPKTWPSLVRLFAPYRVKTIANGTYVTGAGFYFDNLRYICNNAGSDSIKILETLLTEPYASHITSFISSQGTVRQYDNKRIVSYGFSGTDLARLVHNCPNDKADCLEHLTSPAAQEDFNKLIAPFNAKNPENGGLGLSPKEVVRILTDGDLGTMTTFDQLVKPQNLNIIHSIISPQGKEVTVAGQVTTALGLKPSTVARIISCDKMHISINLASLTLPSTWNLLQAATLPKGHEIEINDRTAFGINLTDNQILIMLQTSGDRFEAFIRLLKYQVYAQPKQNTSNTGSKKVSKSHNTPAKYAIGKINKLLHPVKKALFPQDSPYIIAHCSNTSFQNVTPRMPNIKFTFPQPLTQELTKSMLPESVAETTFKEIAKQPTEQTTEQATEQTTEKAVKVLKTIPISTVRLPSTTMGNIAIAVRSITTPKKQPLTIGNPSATIGSSAAVVKNPEGTKIPQAIKLLASTKAPAVIRVPASERIPTVMQIPVHRKKLPIIKKIPPSATVGSSSMNTENPSTSYAPTPEFTIGYNEQFTAQDITKEINTQRSTLSLGGDLSTENAPKKSLTNSPSEAILISDTETLDVQRTKTPEPILPLNPNLQSNPQTQPTIPTPNPLPLSTSASQYSRIIPLYISDGEISNAKLKDEMFSTYMSTEFQSTSQTQHPLVSVPKGNTLAGTDPSSGTNHKLKERTAPAQKPQEQLGNLKTSLQNTNNTAYSPAQSAQKLPASLASSHTLAPASATVPVPASASASTSAPAPTTPNSCSAINYFIDEQGIIYARSPVTNITTIINPPANQPLQKTSQSKSIHNAFSALSHTNTSPQVKTIPLKRKSSTELGNIIPAKKSTFQETNTSQGTVNVSTEEELADTLLWTDFLDDSQSIESKNSSSTKPSTSGSTKKVTYQKAGDIFAADELANTLLWADFLGDSQSIESKNSSPKKDTPPKANIIPTTEDPSNTLPWMDFLNDSQDIESKNSSPKKDTPPKANIIPTTEDPSSTFSWMDFLNDSQDIEAKNSSSTKPSISSPTKSDISQETSVTHINKEFAEVYPYANSSGQQKTITVKRKSPTRPDSNIPTKEEYSGSFSWMDIINTSPEEMSKLKLNESNYKSHTQDELNNTLNGTGNFSKQKYTSPFAPSTSSFSTSKESQLSSILSIQLPTSNAETDISHDQTNNIEDYLPILAQVQSQSFSNPPELERYSTR